MALSVPPVTGPSGPFVAFAWEVGANGLWIEVSPRVRWLFQCPEWGLIQSFHPPALLAPERYCAMVYQDDIEPALRRLQSVVGSSGALEPPSLPEILDRVLTLCEQWREGRGPIFEQTSGSVVIKF